MKLVRFHQPALESEAKSGIRKTLLALLRFSSEWPAEGTEVHLTLHEARELATLLELADEMLRGNSK